MARPKAPTAPAASIADTNWKIIAYYVMAGWWILNGIMMFVGSVVISNKLLSGGAAMFASIPLVGAVIGAIFAMTGVGLVMRVELARGIVNILSWITIGLALMRIAGLLMAGFLMGPIVILMMVRSVFDGALAGFQIYLIGETDNYM